MALKTNTVVTRIDDYDGTTGDDVKTRRFTVDVEMELSDTNFAAVNSQIGAIFANARKPAGAVRKTKTRRVATEGAAR